MAFENLSVRITSQTASFERGVNSAQEQLGDFNSEAIQTAAAMQILQSRTNETGDEMRKLGASSLFGAFGLSSAATSAFNAQVGFIGLSVATTASLVPAMFALAAALTPIVTALGGFVTIAAAIGGIGLIGALAAIATNTKTLKNEAQSVISTLQEAFAPAIENATTVLIGLLREFEAIIPQLVPAESTINNLSNLFFDLGSAIINLLPAFVELATSLAQEFLPPFISFIEEVGPQIPGILQDLVGDFEQLLPKLMEAGRLLGRIIPPLTEFGFTVLNVLGPALARMAQIGTQVLNFITQLDSNIQRLIAGLALIAPIIVPLVNLFGGPLLIAVGALIGGVLALRRAWETNFLNIRGITQDAIGRIMTILGDHLPPIIENVQGILNNLRVAWSMVGDEILTIGRFLLDGLSGILTQLFDAILTFAQITTAVLNGDFSEALRVFVQYFKDLFNGVVEFVNEWGNQIQAAVLGIIADVIAGAGTNLANFLNDTLGVDAGRIRRQSSSAAQSLREQAARIRPEQELSGAAYPHAGGVQSPGAEAPPQKLEVMVTSQDDRFEAWVEKMQNQRENRQSRRFTGQTGSAPGR